MALTDEEKATLAALTKKAEEPEESGSSRSRVENVNLTIDLSDDKQVRRAVKAGYLPASYLEDDDDAADGDDGDGGDGGDPPRRRARFE